MAGGGDDSRFAGLTPEQRAAAKAGDFFFQGGNIPDAAAIGTTLGVGTLGFAMVNSWLKNELSKKDSGFSHIVDNIVGTYVKKPSEPENETNKDAWEDFRKKQEYERGRVGYTMYNWIEFLPFPMMEHLTGHLAREWKKARGQIELTEEEIAESKKPLLTRVINRAKSTTRTIFRDVFAIGFASVADINTEYLMTESMRDIEGQVKGAAAALGGYIERTDKIIDFLSQNDGAGGAKLNQSGVLLTVESATMLKGTLEKLGGNLDEIDIGSREGQVALLNQLKAQFSRIGGELSGIGGRLASQKKEGKDMKLSREDAHHIEHCTHQIAAIGQTFRNFSAKVDENTQQELRDQVEGYKTGVTGGIGMLEHVRALEEKKSTKVPQGSYEDRLMLGNMFRDFGNFVNKTAGNLEESGATMTGTSLKTSKFWEGFSNLLDKLKIDKGLAMNWIMAGTCFGPGFNLFRFTAYDVFDNFVWKDAKHKQPDGRTLGEKVSSFIRDKFAVVTSVYAGAAPMALGMKVWQDGMKDGKLADVAQTMGDVAREHKLSRFGYKEDQTSEWWWYRALQFGVLGYLIPGAGYLPVRGAVKGYVDERTKPAFDGIGSIIDTIFGTGKGKAMADATQNLGSATHDMRVASVPSVG